MQVQDGRASSFSLNKQQQTFRLLMLHFLKGLKLFDNGSKYDGEWRAGKPHGRGILFWEDGRCYVLKFVDGEYADFDKIYKTQSTFANDCLVDSTTICPCVKRSLKYRLRIHDTMFIEDDYDYVRQHETKSHVIYVGRENLRRIKGSPPIDLNPNR